jgi:transposase
LEKLRAATDPAKCVYFLDNCCIHKTKLIRDTCEQLGMQLVFNVPYRPEFNGIEEAWAFLKHDFRNKVLKIKTGQQEAQTLDQLVTECIDAVNDTAVKKACDRSMRLIRLQQPFQL